MQRLITLVLMITALGLGGRCSVVSAQGFSSILEKLDRLEARLTQLETEQIKPLKTRLIQLETTQKQGLAELEQQLNQIPLATDPSAADSSIVQLQTRLNHLSAKMEQFQTNTSRPGEAVVIQGLVTDLRELSGELRSTLNPASGISAEIPGMTLSGFVDASYSFDLSSEDNSFGLDQVEVSMEKTLGKRGLVHTDLEWVSDGEGGFVLDAEQGYVTFQLSFPKNVDLTFGKFNAPIGFELLDAPDMYQFSHALVFDYGLPTNLSGAMLSIPWESGFDASVYLSNGWDENVDANTGKTAGGRLGYARGPFGAGGSLIHGTESTDGNDLTVVDLDLTLTPTEKWTLGAEVNYGRDKTDDTTYNWQGFLLMGHCDFNASTGLTLRYDFFDDGDARRLGSGAKETRQALTLASTFALGEGMGALVELRRDFSDEEVFVDDEGKPVKSVSNLAFEMTYAF